VITVYTIIILGIAIMESSFMVENIAKDMPINLLIILSIVPILHFMSLPNVLNCHVMYCLNISISTYTFCVSLKYISSKWLYICWSNNNSNECDTIRKIHSF